MHQFSMLLNSSIRRTCSETPASKTFFASARRSLLRTFLFVVERNSRIDQSPDEKALILLVHEAREAVA
jgi:hypothetical protein